MGSGKTTVGRLLANQLNWFFLDLDDEITRRTGLSVPDIFARYGEPHFRLEETLALTEGLQREHLVLALGGGAPEAEANRELLRSSPDTAVVYLEGSFNLLQARCIAQSAQPGAVPRPVLADASAARERFDLRTPHYAGIATASFDTANASPERVAEAILARLSL